MRFVWESSLTSSWNLVIGHCSVSKPHTQLLHLGNLSREQEKKPYKSKWRTRIGKENRCDNRNTESSQTQRMTTEVLKVQLDTLQPEFKPYKWRTLAYLVRNQKPQKKLVWKGKSREFYNRKLTSFIRVCTRVEFKLSYELERKRQP